MGLHLFAGLRVSDFAVARRWYGRLLGEPTFFAHATEAVWTVADDRSVFIVEDGESAGNGLVTIFVDDLHARVAEIAARGLEAEDRMTYSNVRSAIPGARRVEGAPAARPRSRR